MSCESLVPAFMALNKLKKSADLCQVMKPVIGGDYRCGSAGLTEALDRKALCELFCCCLNNDPHQSCVQDVLFKVELLERNQGYFKPEVPSRNNEPVMSRNDPGRATRSRPGGSRIPDVIVVNDPTRPPVLGNISKVYEMKFPGDDWSPAIGKDGMKQLEAYQAIFKDKLDKDALDENNCNCGEKKREVLKAAQAWELRNNDMSAVIKALGLAGLATGAGGIVGGVLGTGGRILGGLGGLGGALGGAQ